MYTNRTDKKENKFKEIAERRVNKLITGIRNLSNLSSRNYIYTDEQVGAMFKTLRSELSNAEAQFISEKQKNKKFSF